MFKRNVGVRSLLLALGFVLMFAGPANALSSWLKGETGTDSCTDIRPGQTCRIAAIAADSDTVLVNACSSVSVLVYGTGANIVPQYCNNLACTLAEPWITTGLTGDASARFMATGVPSYRLNLDWTAGGAAPTVQIVCTK